MSLFLAPPCRKGDRKRDTETEQRREMNADVQPGNRAEQHDDRQCGDERGEQGVAQWIVILRPDHGGCGEETKNRS